MSHLRLAGRYAKSLIDLAIEQNQLEAVHQDVLFLQAACKISPDFVLLLRSPIIRADRKQRAITAITEGRVGALMSGFIQLLIRKNREEHLPEIIQAMITQYNSIKGIHIVKLTTADDISSELKANIVTKIKKETALKEIELETSVNKGLIGGFVLEFNNNLVDASIARDLREIKKQFDKNIYIPSLR
jgi:F-type H+-transporting ATPase subunit delta